MECLRELAWAEDLRELEHRACDVLATTHVERAEDLAIVDAVGNGERAQHVRQLAVGAEREHVDGAGADLRALEGLRGEAPARMREPFEDEHAPPTPQELRGGEEPTQSRADDDDVVL